MLDRRMVILALAATTIVTACRGARETPAQQAARITGGDPAKGPDAMGRYGCASCHTIPGVKDANATVGPPLSNIASRQILGGHLQNTPQNMMKWIQHPQDVDPKNAMPELGVTDQDAKDITAYLYTLR